MEELTPMMQQYYKVKAQYGDCLLFYRLGDFYELFFEDAKVASRELELVLTGRDCGMAERAPMCGVPFHSAETYIARLVAKGYKVAICEQTEDPALAKGIVRREVIRVITPGTVTESLMLDEGKNNYLAVLCCAEEGVGLSFCDISTGELTVCDFAGAGAGPRAAEVLARFAPTELLTNPAAAQSDAVKLFVSRNRSLMASVKNDDAFDPAKCAGVAEAHFGKSLSELGLADKPLAVRALGAMLTYLYDTEKNNLSNITGVRVYSEEK